MHAPPLGKDLPRSSSLHLLHRIWDELYHASCFPLIVHLPCGSCVFVGLVDVWLDLFLSVPLISPFVCFLFLGISPPICERSPSRVPPYNILVSWAMVSHKIGAPSLFSSLILLVLAQFPKSPQKEPYQNFCDLMFLVSFCWFQSMDLVYSM